MEWVGSQNLSDFFKLDFSQAKEESHLRLKKQEE